MPSVVALTIADRALIHRASVTALLGAAIALSGCGASSHAGKSTTRTSGTATIASTPNTDATNASTPTATTHTASPTGASRPSPQVAAACKTVVQDTGNLVRAKDLAGKLNALGQLGAHLSGELLPAVNASQATTVLRSVGDVENALKLDATGAPLPPTLVSRMNADGMHLTRICDFRKP